MSTRAFRTALAGALISTLAATPSWAQAPAVPDPAAAAPGLQGGALAQGDPQVLDEGPIHEAFAEPVAIDARPRVIVDREPPEPINELAPEVRPEGENVEWIPGYWMWSDEQLDFVWVSGVWRDIPPGRRWTPGHWLKEGGAWQWVSGFWAPGELEQVQMLPHPPESLEVGPSSPAPAANYFWVPGCWIWQGVAYAWRPGYWYLGQPNWVWVPDHYCYTPAGSIFVAGYWDYPLMNRGLLFAPVWWPRAVYGWGSPGWYFRPYSIINTSLLLSSLFIHGHHHHYWYGHGHWRHNHFHPWWDSKWRGHGYDPLWAYHRWHDGHNRPDWANDVRRRFEQRQRQFDGAPANNNLAGGGQGAGGRSRPQPRGAFGGDDSLIRDVRQWANNEAGRPRLRQVSDAEQKVVESQRESWNSIRQARASAESRGQNWARTQSGAGAQGGRTGGGGVFGGASPTGRPSDANWGNVQGGAGGGTMRRGPAGASSARNGGTTGGGSSGGMERAGGERRTGFRGGGYSPGGLGTFGGGNQRGTGASAWDGGNSGSPWASRGAVDAPNGVGNGSGAPATRRYSPAGRAPFGSSQQAGGQSARAWSGAPQPGSGGALRSGEGRTGSQFRQAQPSRGSQFQGPMGGPQFRIAPRVQQGGSSMTPSGGGQSSMRAVRPQPRGAFGGSQFNGGGGAPQARSFRPQGRGGFGGEGGGTQFNRGGGGGRATFGAGGGRGRGGG